MNQEQKANLEQRILDLIGYPFYDNQSRELTRLNRHVKDQMSGVMDEFIEAACSDCAYSCNESNCDRRHNH